MDENTQSNEPVEHIEMPDNVEDMLARFTGQAPEEGAPAYHTVLEVWRETLRPARELQNERVTPQYASRMLSSYPGLTYATVSDVQRAYYDLMSGLLGILEQEVESDCDCLDWPTPEEDALENAHHYKNLLMLWQQAFLQHELEWNAKADDAAIKIAALSETHKAFFGPTGLTQYLENIRFEYTDEDAEALGDVLNEQRDAFLAGSVE